MGSENEFFMLAQDNIEPTIKLLQSELELTDQKAHSMVSMLPDLIISTGNNYSPQQFEAATLFADVSGKYF